MRNIIIPRGEVLEVALLRVRNITLKDETELRLLLDPASATDSSMLCTNSTRMGRLHSESH